MTENNFLTRKEALQALKEGSRVQFHWKDEITEISLDTTLDDLRWNLMANLNLTVNDVVNGKYSIISKLKPCPFCGGNAKIQICDSEGNLRNEEYKLDPWSGLSYSIVHDDKENKGCPIANFYEDGGVVGTILYDSEEELITAWNKRI